MKISIQQSRVCSIALIFLVAILGMSGCAVQQGTKVEARDVSFVKKGQTTKAELINRLGQPTTSSVDGSGKETLIWEYYKHTSDAKSFIPFAGFVMGSTEMEGSTFTVSLDKNKRVADHQIASSRSEGKLGR